MEVINIIPKISEMNAYKNIKMKSKNELKEIDIEICILLFSLYN